MGKTILSLLVATVLLLLGSHAGVTQSRDELEGIKKEIEELKNNQAELQKDLDAIKNAIQGRRTPDTFNPLVLDIGNDPFKGNKNAPVILVDFSDYQ